MSQAVVHLQAMGHSLQIMTSVRKNDEPLSGVPVTTLPGVSPACYKLHSLTLPSWRVVTTILRFRPHIVHLVDETVITGLVQVLCCVLGIPTVFSHHTRIDLIAERYAPGLASLGAHTWLLWLLQRCVGARAAVHLVVGSDMMAQLRGAGCTDLRDWPVGTDTSLFSQSQRCGALHAALTSGAHAPPTPATSSGTNDSACAPTPRLVLYVGRVAPEKSLFMLPAVVDACNAAATNGSRSSGDPLQFYFAVVGDGPFLAQLKASCEGKPVTFLGQIPHGPELARLYATADAFYSPSCFETLGQVYLEAMASGTPVVAAAAAGALEVINHGATGFLARPDDVEDAAHFIREACALKGRVLRAAAATPTQLAGGTPCPEACDTAVAGRGQGPMSAAPMHLSAEADTAKGRGQEPLSAAPCSSTASPATPMLVAAPTPIGVRCTSVAAFGTAPAPSGESVRPLRAGSPLSGVRGLLRPCAQSAGSSHESLSTTTDDTSAAALGSGSEGSVSSPSLSLHRRGSDVSGGGGPRGSGGLSSATSSSCGIHTAARARSPTTVDSVSPTTGEAEADSSVDPLVGAHHACAWGAAALSARATVPVLLTPPSAPQAGRPPQSRSNVTSSGDGVCGASSLDETAHAHLFLDRARGVAESKSWRQSFVVAERAYYDAWLR